MGAELARLRGQAGLSGREMARLLGISQPTVSRIELAERLPNLQIARAWLDKTAADEVTKTNVLALLEAAHSETVAYRLQARAVAHLQGHVSELEAQTRHLYSITTAAVHGLLQVPEYATAVIRLADSEQMIDQAAALEARLQRQSRLQDRARTFSFVMLEQVLRAPFVPAAQLDHIAQLAIDHENITIGIVPIAASWPAVPWHGFNLYELDEGTRIVVAELIHGEATVTGDDDLALYRRLHDQWAAIAYTGQRAAELCRTIASNRGH